MIPFWGDPRLMRETIDSVLAQTSGDWLLTVVDDAYPDDTISAYLAALEDPRVTYVRKEQNEGSRPTTRRASGWRPRSSWRSSAATTCCSPTTSRRSSRRTRVPSVDVIQPGVQVIDEKGEVVSTLVDTVKRRLMMPRVAGPTVLAGEELATSLLHADWLYWPSLVFRRDRLLRTPFRQDFPLIQDLALIIDMVCDGATLLVEPTLCFSYRRHGASASSARLLDGTRFVGERRYFALAAQEVERLGWRRARRAARVHLTSRLHALTLLPKALRTQGRPRRPCWSMPSVRRRPLDERPRDALTGRRHSALSNER
ncbi:glycosyltransferase [Oerskovia sp. M15]